MILRLLYRIVLFCIYTALAAPIAVIVVVAFGESPLLEFPPTGFTLHWFEVFFSNSDMMTALFSVSLPVALCTSVISVAIAVPASVAVVRYQFPGRDLLFALINLPLMVPQVLLAVAMLLLMLLLGMRTSPAWLVLGHVMITLPFVASTTIASLSKVEPSFEEAAMNLGSSRFGAFMRITMPMIRGGVLGGAILSFIISFADCNVALFLSGPGAVTLPVYTFTSIMFQSEPDLAAGAAVQIAIVAVMMLILGKVAGLRRG